MPSSEQRQLRLLRLLQILILGSLAAALTGSVVFLLLRGTLSGIPSSWF